MEQGSRYFRNARCEYFPCHQVADDGFFNCLFCYCPLYFLPDCGGRPQTTPQGIRDCTACAVPHLSGGYEHVLKRLRREFAAQRANKA